MVLLNWQAAEIAVVQDGLFTPVHPKYMNDRSGVFPTNL
jgi:hypothetical protein